MLFLSGPSSGFWAELGDAVAARGGRVLRINLNLGDRLFWRRPGAIDYRGALRAWPRWLRGYLRAEGVTDVIYYADRPPYHRLAAAVARAEGIAAHAVEFGYLRPDWLTVEPMGGGAYSHFPADPAALDPGLPPPDLTVRHAHPFWREALGEVAWNMAASLGRPLYPLRVADRPTAPVVEYLRWGLKLARARSRARAALAAQARLLAGDAPYFLVILQLPIDYQLRASAWRPRQADFLADVIRSFAAHAPAGTRLAVKTHPLDDGWTDWPAMARRLAAEAGAAGRVEGLDGGDLATLLAGARGAVTANSTAGLTALRMGRPVRVMGAAVYAMAGLTDNRPLDAFWTDPIPPDPDRLAAFVATLAARIQVKGSFYDPAGRRLAAAAIAQRLTEGPPPAPPAGPPPRLAALRAVRAALAQGADAGRIAHGVCEVLDGSP